MMDNGYDSFDSILQIQIGLSRLTYVSPTCTCNFCRLTFTASCLWVVSLWLSAYLTGEVNVD